MFQFEHKLLNESISEHSVWSTLFWHTHTEYSLSMEYVLSALRAIQYNTRHSYTRQSLWVWISQCILW